MVMLINKKGLMKEWTNSHLYNAVAWISVVIMIGLTLALASITVKQMTQPGNTAVEQQSKPVAQVKSYNSERHSLKTNVAESRLSHLLSQLGRIWKSPD